MESLVLFDSVVNSRWFMRTSIILFLNKVDLFRQKLGRSPLSNYFPDYSGGNDVNRAAKYLLWRFNQVNRAHLNLYPQYVYRLHFFHQVQNANYSLLVSRKPLIRLIFVLFSPPWKRPFFKMRWKTPAFYDFHDISIYLLSCLPLHANFLMAFFMLSSVMFPFALSYFICRCPWFCEFFFSLCHALSAQSRNNLYPFDIPTIFSDHIFSFYGVAFSERCKIRFDVMFGPLCLLFSFSLVATCLIVFWRFDIIAGDFFQPLWPLSWHIPSSTSIYIPRAATLHPSWLSSFFFFITYSIPSRVPVGN